MRRIFWTLLFVGVCIGWLVLSYRPELLAGKDVALGPDAGPYFVWLFAGSALLFVIIQLLLVVSVRTFPSSVQRGGKNWDDIIPTNDKEIRIHSGAEFFWTALPLFISLALFWAVWQFLTGM